MRLYMFKVDTSAEERHEPLVRHEPPGSQVDKFLIVSDLMVMVAPVKIVSGTAHSETSFRNFANSLAFSFESTISPVTRSCEPNT